METILVCVGADRSDVAAEVGIEGDWVRLSPRRTGVAMITTGQKTTRGTCSGDRLALQRARRPIVARSCQVVARAFAFIWSNSAWVIVPASRSCLADAI